MHPPCRIDPKPLQQSALPPELRPPPPPPKVDMSAHCHKSVNQQQANKHKLACVYIHVYNYVFVYIYGRCVSGSAVTSWRDGGTCIVAECVYIC